MTLGARPRVLIAGAGVAGLETLLALRASAGARVEVTLVAPEPKFINRSMSVDQPFKPQRVRGISLQDIADALDAQWHRGTLDRVEHARRRAVTKEGRELGYDLLVLAPGARSTHTSRSRAVITFRGNRDAPQYRMLLHQLASGQVERLAFVIPPAPSWPSPLYDLSLLTAAYCADRHLDVELRIITPEPQPLSIFGDAVSSLVRQRLAAAGIAVHTHRYGAVRADGSLELRPGRSRLAADRIVTLPTLVGPRLRGVPCSGDGFLQTDRHGRISGLNGVYAAGDATTFPVKQGGLAAQQADAVAETIAASVGAAVHPKPFRPVLRAALLTGRSPLYMRADISVGTSIDSVASEEPLWWPPIKLCGRYLAPFLSSRVGDAADVMPQHARSGS
jgi:sulfide:quinone oxidoreductase